MAAAGTGHHQGVCLFARSAWAGENLHTHCAGVADRLVPRSSHPGRPGPNPRRDRIRFGAQGSIQDVGRALTVLYTATNKDSCGRLGVLKKLIILAGCSIIVVGCASDPGRTADTQFCEGASVDSSGPMPTASPESPPPSNIFDLKYMYPTNLQRDRLEGRALVRLTVDASGKIEKVQFLRLEAPFPVKSAMCNLLQKLRYDLPKSGFETPESRTWVIGLRYLLKGSPAVRAYPGFEKREISIAASYL
jgi:hypothetical protein